MTWVDRDEVRISFEDTGSGRCVVLGHSFLCSREMWAYQATDLAEYVMLSCDLDYRSAYHLVGSAVRTASRQGLRGIDITSEMLDAAAEEVCGRALGLDAARLADVLDPRNIVATRTAAGGAAPSVVAEMAARYQHHAEQLVIRSELQIQEFDTTEAALVAEAREVAGS